MIAAMYFFDYLCNLIWFEYFNWNFISCIMLILFKWNPFIYINNTNIYYEHELYPNTSICVGIWIILYLYILRIF